MNPEKRLNASAKIGKEDNEWMEDQHLMNLTGRVESGSKSPFVYT